MTTSSWTVFFMFKPYTTIYTTILIDKDEVKDEILIKLAKSKIQTELGLNIDEVAVRLGVNQNLNDNWIKVEWNDSTATEEELKVLPINKFI